MPQALRNLALDISIVCTQQQQQQQQQQQAEPGYAIRVAAACDLPAGWPWFTPASAWLLHGHINAQQLLVESGPWALAAAAAAGSGRAVVPIDDVTASTAPDGAWLPPATEGTAVMRVSQQDQRRMVQVHHVYEIVMGLPANDIFKDRKLDLLRATGLGLCQYLSDGTEQQQQQQLLNHVLTAMAVAMCDDQELLQAWLVQQIEQQDARCIASKVNGLAASVSSTAAMLLEDDQGKVVGSPSHAAPPAESMTTAPTAPAAGTGTGTGSRGLNMVDAADHENEHIAAAAAGSKGSGTATVSGTRHWPVLQQQLLHQYGKLCVKQLRMMLKQELQAVQLAQQAIAAVKAGEPPSIANSNYSRSLSSSCCCAAAFKPVLHTTNYPGDNPEEGVKACLMGMQQLLSSWLQQEHGSCSSRKQSRRDGARGTGMKKHRRQSCV
jgi:hypothetical protein